MKNLTIFVFLFVSNLCFAVDPYTIIVDQMNGSGTNYVVRQITKPSADGILRYNMISNSPEWLLSSVLTVTSSQISDSTSFSRAVMTAADQSTLQGMLNIPTTVSQLINDSGYQNAANLAAAVSGKMNIPAGSSSQVVLGNGTIGSVPSQTASNISDFNSAADARVVLGVVGKYNIPAGTTSQYVRGDGSLATLPVSTSRIFSYPTRALNTCFQVSSNRDALVSYTVEIATSISLSGGSTGTVYLRTYTNSACNAGTQEVTRISNGQSGALTIGLNITQTVSLKLVGMAPAGTWVQLVTENNTGTPTFTARPGQETLL